MHAFFARLKPCELYSCTHTWNRKVFWTGRLASRKLAGCFFCWPTQTNTFVTTSASALLPHRRGGSTQRVLAQPSPEEHRLPGYGRYWHAHGALQRPIRVLLHHNAHTVALPGLHRYFPGLFHPALRSVLLHERLPGALLRLAAGNYWLLFPETLWIIRSLSLHALIQEIGEFSALVT